MTFSRISASRRRCVMAVVVAVLVGSTGCYGAHSYGTTYPPTQPSQIGVVSLGQIPRDYEIIGEVRGDAWLHSIAYLKELAAGLGADAISIPQFQAGYIVSQAIKYKTAARHQTTATTPTDSSI